ncbi:MAG: hypothetical protein ACLRQ0_09590 [Monoglobales bacterium]
MKKNKGKKKWIILGTAICALIATVVPSKIAEKSFKNIRFEREDD